MIRIHYTYSAWQNFNFTFTSTISSFKQQHQISRIRLLNGDLTTIDRFEEDPHMVDENKIHRLGRHFPCQLV